MGGLAVVTGSGGVVGSEMALRCLAEGMTVVGIDNDTRGKLLGAEASTQWRIDQLRVHPSYTHYDGDIRDRPDMMEIFTLYEGNIDLVVHTAAQPSHDWSAQSPYREFLINAVGTLSILDATRVHANEAVFIFCSTNKVYGDCVNQLPLVESETRYDIDVTQAMGHVYMHGVDEHMRIDQCMHSPFGVSKAAADLMVQEYGRYFGLNTVCFRGGCLTGAAHSGTKLHGFLAYLMKCLVEREPYTIFGYKGKQVRDNLDAEDLIEAFWLYFQNPREPGEVYNIGGGRGNSCSILEALRLAGGVVGRSIRHTYSDQSRKGDHKWWITDTRKFQRHYPEWRVSVDLSTILEGMYRRLVDHSRDST